MKFKPKKHATTNANGFDIPDPENYYIMVRFEDDGTTVRIRFVCPDCATDTFFESEAYLKNKESAFRIAYYHFMADRKENLNHD